MYYYHLCHRLMIHLHGSGLTLLCLVVLVLSSHTIVEDLCLHADDMNEPQFVIQFPLLDGWHSH